MSKVLSLSLKDALYAELSAIAELNNKSVLDVIRDAITLYMEALEALDDNDLNNVAVGEY
jgi:predicted transcriptional regulator